MLYTRLRRTILSATFSFICISSCAPRISQDSGVPVLTRINIIDQNGTSETISSCERLQKFAGIDYLEPQPYQKVLRVFSRDACGNLPSIITSYHPNGIPSQYLEVVNGRAKGTYLEWYQDGTQKISGSVVGGAADLTASAMETWLFDGFNRAWDEEGRLQAELEYCKGELHGAAIYYHKNGEVWKQISFKRGLIDGCVDIFRENGEIFQRISYVNGNKNGPATRYWCADLIASEECYFCGRLDNGRYYDINGKVVAEIIDGTGFRATFGKESIIELQEYVNGVQDGKVLVFAKTGGVVQVYHTKNGVKHGEEFSYYDKLSPNQNPKPKLMLTWCEGKIQGITKTWYPNGNQESLREMSNNTKNGHSTAWYEDGNLMLVEEYEKDKLMKGEYYKKGDFIPVSQVINGSGTATLFNSDGSFLRKIEYNQGIPQESES